VGVSCGTYISTGNYNTAVNGLGGINYNGSWCTIIGRSAGGSYVGSESNNICIGNTGTVGESNTIHIGTTGSGAGQQNAAYIAGIYGVTPGGTKNVALVDNNGQLGSVAALTPTYGGRNSVVNCNTSNAISMNTNTDYIATSTDGSTKVVFTLPATFAVGDRIRVIGSSSGLWEIDQNAANTIFYNNSGTTPGVTGKVSVVVAHQYVSVTLMAITTANWVITDVSVPTCISLS
jgi:hypothetical protein